MRGKRGSRYHLAVEKKQGLPLALQLSAGNENERRHVLPLLDELDELGFSPAELCADRGYDGKPLNDSLLERGVKPEISKRRRPGEPVPEGVKTWVVTRGTKKQVRCSDPNASRRWMIERTNAWLRSCPRIDVRRDVQPENYLAFLQLRMITLLTGAILR